jgi:uncharacterized coiled-coil DUF342 family protein
VDIGAVYRLLLRVAETVDGHTRILNDHSRSLDERRDKLNEQSVAINALSRNVNEQRVVLNEHTLLLHAHDRKLDDLTDGQASLRQAVTEYHSSVLGHGILISELDRRVRRIDDHLQPTSAA